MEATIISSNKSTILMIIDLPRPTQNLRMSPYPNRKMDANLSFPSYVLV